MKKIDKNTLSNKILKELLSSPSIISPGQAIYNTKSTPTPVKTSNISDTKSNVTEVNNSSIDRIKVQRNKVLKYMDKLMVDDIDQFKVEVKNLIDLLGFVDSGRRI